MSKTIAVLIAAAAASLLAMPAFAGQQSATLDVTATVAPSCSVGGSTSTTTGSLTAFSFGTFGSTIPASTTGTAVTLFLTCTNGTAYWLGVDNGANFSGGVRNMKLTTGSAFVPYHISTKGDGTGVGLAAAGATGPVTGNISGTANGLSDNFPIYFTTPGASGLASGLYKDTVQVQVAF